MRLGEFGMNIKRLYGSVLKLLEDAFGADFAKQFDSQFRFQRKLNLKNPKTLADKVSYLELHKPSPLASFCSDKYAVRTYVADKGLDDILIPTVGGPWTEAEEVDFCALPDRFVLKATHGCKMNYIVPDKKKLDEGACRKEMERWMDTTYGVYSMEPHYRSIPHRIYCEQFLEEASKLMDYKIHCFNGRPEFIMVSSDRRNNGDKAMHVTQELYDINWKPIFEVKRSGFEIPGDGKKPVPEHLDEMLRVARILSEGIDFVRIDLYDLKGRVYFGEMTFSPACGIFPYMTDQFISEMGGRLKI